MSWWEASRMATELGRVQKLIELAKGARPIRLAVIGAGQGLALEGVQRAKSLGLVDPDWRRGTDLAARAKVGMGTERRVHCRGP